MRFASDGRRKEMGEAYSQPFAQLASLLVVETLVQTGCAVISI
jgi:hypothetical protein